MPRKVAPITLAIDIGGTGLKATALDSKGAMLTERVRVETPYPLPPSRLVEELQQLVAPVTHFDRVSVGFPGMVRSGLILSAPHLVLRKGPGSARDPKLVKEWHRFDLATALADAFGKPTRVVNDADLQALDAASGTGLEVVVTLGTGFGTGVVMDGRLAPHLEIAQHRFRKGETYDEQIGDAARKEVGNTRWNHRVREAIAALETMMMFDHLYIGGGNARHLTGRFASNVTIIDQNAGLLGGIRLWDQHPHTP
jgi:polyphosphate glucokinase